RKLHLNVLTRGTDNIHRYYHLHKAEIPVSPVNDYNLTNFVKGL
ncbi:6560_t:CDS:1, partial [Dentiscutata erythropus]